MYKPEQSEMRYSWSISLDEMSPVFDHEAGTVTFKSEHFSEAMKKGHKVRVGSNENPGKDSIGEVIEIDSNTHTIKIKLFD